MIQQPDGIIITISAGMLKEKGYKNWLQNFLFAMTHYEKEWTYWMRLGSPVKRDIVYVYLCIGGKVRFRAFFGGNMGGGEMTFGNWAGGPGKTLTARAWITLAGPLERPPRGQTFPMKGFRGFRYTEKLF